MISLISETNSLNKIVQNFMTPKSKIKIDIQNQP